MFMQYLAQIEGHDAQYPNLLIPMDAIGLQRLLMFEDFASEVESLIHGSGKPEKEVLLAVKAYLDTDPHLYSLVRKAIYFIIEQNTK